MKTRRHFSFFLNECCIYFLPHVERKNSDSDDEKDNKEYNMGHRMITGAVGVATVVGTQQMMKYQHAKKNGVTLVMIVVITKHKVFLLDWKGSHDKGKFTEILFEFSRSKCNIKHHSRGLVHHTIDITEGGHHCKIECNIGATHSNKKMNRECIELLQQN
ncbi:MAG: hypothetical protein ACI8RD_014077 [Bacillariaceae sp.]|jgi:hypothetical protein